MKPYLQLIPITVLFAGAVIAVWRGFDPKSDRAPGNRNKKRKWWD